MTSRVPSDLAAELFDALDWRALGEIYCDDGGDAFWHEHRPLALAHGLAWADAAAERLPRGGSSLWVGAGVAELPVVLSEALELGRTVRIANLRDVECIALNDGLRAVGVPAEQLVFEPRDGAELAAEGPFDHIGLVSVLTDPEAWPVTSAVTYGRVPPVLLDVAVFEAERRRLVALCEAVLGALELPGLVTTTVEEVPWILHWAEAHGARVAAADATVESALVGDPIGWLRVDALKRPTVPGR